MTTIDLLRPWREKRRRSAVAVRLVKWRKQNRERYVANYKAWYARNRKRRLEEDGQKRAALRAAVLDRLGGVCSWCGHSDPLVLDVDHIHGGGNKERDNKGANQAKFYKSILAGTRADIRLLCRNCNWRAWRKAGPPQRKESECVVWSS